MQAAVTGPAAVADVGFECKVPGPHVVAATVVTIAGNAHPALRNEATTEAAPFTFLGRVLPEGASESRVRRMVKLEAEGDVQPQGSVS